MVHLSYRKGDLFDAPEYSVLIHACNTKGNWNAGIAKEFKKRYPYAYYVYNRYCTIDHNITNNPVQTGTCLLIPPCEYDTSIPKHWIACLFTSNNYGKNKDSRNQILDNTRLAIIELLYDIKISEVEGSNIQELRACKINSGYFGVEWKDTEKVILDISLNKEYRDRLTVYYV